MNTMGHQSPKAMFRKFVYSVKKKARKGKSEKVPTDIPEWVFIVKDDDEKFHELTCSSRTECTEISAAATTTGEQDQ